MTTALATTQMAESNPQPNIDPRMQQSFVAGYPPGIQPTLPQQFVNGAGQINPAMLAQLQQQARFNQPNAYPNVPRANPQPPQPQQLATAPNFARNPPISHQRMSQTDLQTMQAKAMQQSYLQQLQHQQHQQQQGHQPMAAAPNPTQQMYKLPSQQPPRPPTAAGVHNSNAMYNNTVNGYMNGGVYQQPQQPTPQQQQHFPQQPPPLVPATVPMHSPDKLKQRMGSVGLTGAPSPAASQGYASSPRNPDTLPGTGESMWNGNTAFNAQVTPNALNRSLSGLPLAEQHTSGFSSHGIPPSPQTLGKPRGTPQFAHHPQNAAAMATLMNNPGLAALKQQHPHYPQAGPSSIAGPSQPARPPLPSQPNLVEARTRRSVIPIDAAETKIPPMSTDEVNQLRTWMDVDRQWEVEREASRKRMELELSEIGGKARWFERDPKEEQQAGRRRENKEKFGVLWPTEKRQRRERKMKHMGRKDIRLPRAPSPSLHKVPEQLIPIRLDIDIEHNKFRDTFVWNVNDPIVTPQHVAQSICDDFKLGPHALEKIIKSVNEQVADFRMHSLSLLDDPGSRIAPAIGTGRIVDDDEDWWESWRKRQRIEGGYVRGGKKRDAAAETEVVRRGRTNISLPGGDEGGDSASRDGGADEELRILIKLDIMVGSMKLEDQFEWDLSNPNNSPELFAEGYCIDLGLSGEVKTAIAHCIREQVYSYQKSLFLVDYQPEGKEILDDDLKATFLPSLSNAKRSVDQALNYMPIINYYSDGEMERSEREQKRKKRQTKGRRGILLPDRDPPKTNRTVALGYVDADPAVVAGQNVPTMSRRAAAVNASATIASMVASENASSSFIDPIPTLTHRPTNVAVPIPTLASAKNSKAERKRLMLRGPLLKLDRKPRTSIPKTTGLDSTGHIPAFLAEANDVLLSRRLNKNKKGRDREEREREKEREFADGQHPCDIDGVWHCSNCGIPAPLAVGRRKGPLGDKTMCGPCGKFWHQYRRPKPMKYNTDPQYHMDKDEAERKDKINRRRGKRNVAVEDDAPVIAPIPVSPSKKTEATPSPESSPSPPPLASRSSANRANGMIVHSSPTPPPAVSPPKSPAINRRAHTPSPIVPVSAGAVPPPVVVSPTSSSTHSQRPEWLKDVLHAMQMRYPDDRFDVVPRPRPATGEAPSIQEWRVKCTDCPGKLYNFGPGETLTNFEVHLKNRNHRAKVNQRLFPDGTGTSVVPPSNPS